jgi:hypothetical protein
MASRHGSAYLHKVVHCIVQGWPQDKVRDLLPDRMLASHTPRPSLAP